MREKVEHQKLLDAIKLMEERSQSKSTVKQRMLEEHRGNMRYMDEKIANHEDTFLKFKHLYESLKTNSSFFKYNSHNHNASSNGFTKAERRPHLEESVITARSTLHEGDRSEWPRMNESMNVVSEMEC